MTFCPNCGASPVPGAPACPRCGKTANAAAPLPQAQLYPMQRPVYSGQSAPPPPPAYPAYPVHQQLPAVPAGTNTMALLGFVLIWLPLPFAGLVLCILGLIQCGQTGQKGKGLAIAGILLRLLGIAALVAAIVIGVWYMADFSYYLHGDWEWNEGFAYAALGMR